MDAFKEIAIPWYVDQALPFDITVTAANEYGAAAASKIFGVEILNESYGMSIEDSVSESLATFVARSVSPLQQRQLRHAAENTWKSARGPAHGRFAKPYRKPAPNPT